ncbi:hypothetical protein QZH56_01575 [Streptomyces olivoreticuli]|uniref:MFS transporter n=1 Tax=Streptomyces olivoreticuli TaxID=68246 RepID=UPI0026587FDA|nr:MFS transporter [Streptomyces olivoreticuli]WKK24380.1 hypothetical protein QZH56_01575 [Streptomyces olivoreticuli]
MEDAVDEDVQAPGVAVAGREQGLTGLAGFTAASVACGLATGPATLIAARLVQGAFGALLIPQGFGILGAVFPRDQIGTAFSAFGPVLGLSAVGGPILAATLIDTDPFGLGWRSMFLIDIVLGGAALIAAHRLLPRDTGDRTVMIDTLGSLLLAGAMSTLLYGLIDGSGHHWRPAAWAALAAAAVFFALFARRRTTAANPLIRPSLFRNRGFVSGLVLGTAFFAAVAGLLYVISLFLQGGLGYTTLRTALTGVTTVFLYAAPDRITDFIDHAQQAGVTHVVLLSSSSVLGPDPDSDPLAKSHLDVERALLASPLTTTILRPGSFASNAGAWAWPIKAGRPVSLPFPGAHNDPIHERTSPKPLTLPSPTPATTAAGTPSPGPSR